MTSIMGESRDGGKCSHNGYDISGNQGMPLVNNTKGKLVIVSTHSDPGNKTAGGNSVTFYVEGDPNTHYTYRHLSQLPPEGTTEIAPGESFGAIGGEKGKPGSGFSTDGPHLHMEAKELIDGKWVKKDPITQQVSAGVGKTVMQEFETFDKVEGVSLLADSVSLAALKDTVASLVISEGLDAVDPLANGLVGNPHLKRIARPISFKILLNDFLPSTFLSNGDSPLELKLNCSLSQFNIQMKHVINKSNTRTGFHLTFWGMEPDTITGSGSTGVFINSAGLTALMSLNHIPEVSLEDMESLDGSETPGRVTAQDNFVELLSVFKNNGIVRFHTENYDDAISSRKQLEAVWSEQYGANTFERGARNNDVLSKGSVLLSYKNNLFQGYFKNLSWTMDADNPYQWKFDFTFLVQKTINFVRYGDE